jgi:putative oxidoreductase
MSVGVTVGLLILRLALAALLLGHSAQKLLAWFQGMGPSGHGAVFEKWGFRPGRELAVLAGLCELIGAGSLALGFIVPGGCAVVIGTMIVAAAPNTANGLWAHLGGCEVPVVYAAIATALAFTGPGRYSLDHVLGLGVLENAGWGVAAVVVGVLAAIPPLLRRRRERRRTLAPV